MKMRLLVVSVFCVLFVVSTADAVTRYVWQGGGNQAPYTSWDTASWTIQPAVNAAQAGDTVLVWDGTYQLSSQVYIAKPITLRSANGSALTIIDAKGSSRCVDFASGLTAAAYLSGFTLINGVAGGPAFMDGNGGGLRCNASTVHLDDVVVKDCQAAFEGGGIYYATSDGTLRDIWIEGNSSGQNGAGFRSSYGTLSLVNITVISNSSPEGAGMHIYHSAMGITNCFIAYNNATGEGGGAMYFDGSSPEIMNATIYNNRATGDGEGGGLNVSYNSHPKYKNCVLWSNWPQQVFFNADWGGMAITFEYSDLQDGPDGIGNKAKGPVNWLTGNMTNDPLLSADGRLQAGSPCIDAGTDVGAMSTDLVGIHRQYDPAKTNPVSDVDMGAFEYSFAGLWFIQPLGFSAPVVENMAWGSGFGFIPVPGDYNNDGTNDLAVYEYTPGNWFIRQIGDGPPICFGQQWGGAGLVPVYGDYNGDGVDDLAVFAPATGNWYIRSLGPGDPICFGQEWGAGCTPVPGDYNGDGVWDLAVFHVATGNWYIRSLGPGDPICFGENWGGPGFTPVPGDYNNDGVWDLAVYESVTGNWYIRSLGPGDPICFGQNWGALCTPVSGDYNGDGVFDLSVYQVSTGNWYIRSLGPIGPSNPPITFGQHWGTTSCVPVSGDFDGDGLDDLAIYDY